MAPVEATKDRRIRKDERINFRVSSAMKSVLVRAAEVSGRSLTDFIAYSAFSAAQKAIEEAGQLQLAEEDRVVFLDALSNPTAPNDALKAAAARYRKLVE